MSSSLKQHFEDYEKIAQTGFVTIAETVPQPTKFIDLMDPNKTVLDWTDKVIFVVLLQVKHSLTTSGKLNTSILTRGDKGSSYKRQKLQHYQSGDNGNWDRMYVFADLLDNGRCLVMLKTKTRESMDFTSINRKRASQILTGGVFAIFEPTPTDDRRKLGSMPMATSEYPLFPLPFAAEKFTIKNTIPTYMPNKLEVGEQKYFIIHDVQTLEINGFRLDNTYTCKGRECDKAHKLFTNQHCGCTAVGNHRNVGCFNVVFDNPFGRDRIHNEDKVVVRLHRSLRTTNMFFEDVEEYAREYSDVNCQSMKKQIKRMVKYINNKGGWTIVGWFRKGETIEEVATNDTDRVESDTVKCHLSYLGPTDATVLNKKEYKELLVDKNIASNA